eukprot:437558-Rhodomonas_salina.2
MQRAKLHTVLPETIRSPPFQYLQWYKGTLLGHTRVRLRLHGPVGQTRTLEHHTPCQHWALHGPVCVADSGVPTHQYQTQPSVCVAHSGDHLERVEIVVEVRLVCRVLRKRVQRPSSTTSVPNMWYLATTSQAAAHASSST